MKEPLLGCVWIKVSGKPSAPPWVGYHIPCVQLAMSMWAFAREDHIIWKKHSIAWLCIDQSFWQTLCWRPLVSNWQCPCEHLQERITLRAPPDRPLSTILDPRRCVVVLLCRCAIAPLCSCTIVSLYYCVVVLLCRCTAVLLLCRYVAVLSLLLYCCDIALLCHCTVVSLYCCIVVPLCCCAVVLLFNCTVVLLCCNCVSLYCYNFVLLYCCILLPSYCCVVMLLCCPYCYVVVELCRSVIALLCCIVVVLFFHCIVVSTSLVGHVWGCGQLCLRNVNGMCAWSFFNVCQHSARNIQLRLDRHCKGFKNV